MDAAEAARGSAAEEVARLLASPDDLRHLGRLRAEFRARREAAQAQLQVAVAAHVGASAAALEAVAAARAALLALREHLGAVRALCAECQQAIDCHDKIQRLAAVHYNLHRTLQDMEAVAALPAEAAGAEELLADDGALLQAYECLAALQGTAAQVQRALGAAQGGGGGGGGPYSRVRDLDNLRSYFQRVEAAMGRFEERLWSIVRGFHALARKRPGLLVAAFQVIEVQEAVDAQLGAASPLRKAWRRRAAAQVGMAVQDRFAPLLQRCSQLCAAGEDTQARLEAVLADADAFVAELADAADHATPCFPPHYRLFAAVAASYHQQLGSMVDFVGLCADNLANADIVRALAWVARYQDALVSLGVEDEDAELEGPGVAMLVAKYAERTGETLRAWLANIVGADFAGAPKVSPEGRMWTPGAIEFFRILHEQVGVVAGVGSDALAAQAGAQAVATMAEYQDAQRRCMAEGLALEQLAAMANNNLRCHAESAEFAAQLRADGLVRPADEAELEANCAGFAALAREAVAACAESVMSDPGFMALFAQLCCTPDWRTGAVAANILATVDDFLGDLRGWLDPSLLPQLADGLLTELCAHFLAAALVFLKMVTEEELRYLERDTTRLEEFFERFLGPGKAALACQPLRELNEWLCSGDPEAFVLGFAGLLACAPGLTPTLLSGVLSARVAAGGEFSRADAREVLEGCRELWAARPQQPQQQKTASTAAVARRAYKSAAYKAAVLALLGGGGA